MFAILPLSTTYQIFGLLHILAAIVAGTRIRRFELAQPSLHDIFVQIARPEPEEVTDA